MSSVKIKFVSQIINKIRWRPKSSSVFVTGSCDDDENTITVWNFPDPSSTGDIDEEMVADIDPRAASSVQFPGCVTDLKVISDDILFASSSLGSLSMYKYSEEKLQQTHIWKNVHHFKHDAAPATGIAVKGQEIATIGEDGRLCVFNFTASHKVKEIECSDLCPLTAINYLRHQEVVVGNSLGYLRVWDIRSPSNASSALLVLSRDQRGVSSMNIHPTQAHILATGYEDGSLCIWDMRQDKKPTTLLEGHFAAITELQFHPTNPDFLYTCSTDGSVWQWDASNLRSNVSKFGTPSESNVAAAANPWLNCEANKHKLEISSLYSQSMSCVNSLDFSVSTLLWATDNEALYILSDIAI